MYSKLKLLAPKLVRTFFLWDVDLKKVNTGKRDDESWRLLLPNRIDLVTGVSDENKYESRSITNAWKRTRKKWFLMYEYSSLHLAIIIKALILYLVLRDMRFQSVQDIYLFTPLMTLYFYVIGSNNLFLLICYYFAQSNKSQRVDTFDISIRFVIWFFSHELTGILQMPITSLSLRVNCN